MQNSDSLNTKQLLDLCKILQVSQNLKSYINSEIIDTADFPNLANLFENLYSNPGIVKSISTTILDENTIDDNASTNLKNIRNNIRKKEQEIEKRLKEAEKLGFPSKRLILSGCTSPEQLARDPELHKRGLFFLNIEEVVKFIVLYNDPMVQIDQFIQLMSDPWSYIKKHGMDIIEEYINDVVSCYKLLHAAAVNMPKTLLDSIIDRTFQKADIPLSVWTVNEPELVQSCLSEKVFNITTRKVRQAIKLREDYFNGI